MNKKEIINTLRSYAKLNGFEYDEAPIPYFPFGEINGTLDDGNFTLSISRAETRSMAWYNTHFMLNVPHLVPKGFCVVYIGDLYKKEKIFDDRIEDRSDDDQISFLTHRNKCNLVLAFDEIDKIDEEIFKARSSLRISEYGVGLNVVDIPQNSEQLNAVYAKVIAILIDIKTALEN